MNMMEITRSVGGQGSSSEQALAHRIQIYSKKSSAFVNTYAYADVNTSSSVKHFPVLETGKLGRHKIMEKQQQKAQTFHQIMNLLVTFIAGYYV